MRCPFPLSRCGLSIRSEGNDSVLGLSRFISCRPMLELDSELRTQNSEHHLGMSFKLRELIHASEAASREGIQKYLSSAQQPHQRMEAGGALPNRIQLPTPIGYSRLRLFASKKRHHPHLRQINIPQSSASRTSTICQAFLLTHDDSLT